MKKLTISVAVLLVFACSVVFTACLSNGDIPFGEYKMVYGQIGDNPEHRFIIQDMYDENELNWHTSVMEKIVNKLAEFGVNSGTDSESLAYKIKNYYETHAGKIVVSVVNDLISIDARMVLGIETGSKSSKYSVDETGLILFESDMSSVTFVGNKNWSFENNEIYLNQHAIDGVSYSYVYPRANRGSK